MDTDDRSPVRIAHDTPLTRDEIAPLLDNLAGPDRALRIATLSALVTLPLVTEAWLAVSERLQPFLRADANPDAELLEAAVHVPTRRVRNVLHALADTIADPDVRRVLTHDLARAGDRSAVPHLLEDFRGENDHLRRLAAEYLSLFAVPEARGEFVQVAANDPLADTRFWSAICLAQLGEPEALKRELTSVAPASFEPERTQSNVESELSLLWGDPASAFVRIQGRGPWPAATQFMLEGLAEQNDGSIPWIIIESLLAGHGEPDVDDWSSDVVQREQDPAKVSELRERARALRAHLERTFPEDFERAEALETLAYLPGEDTASFISHLWMRLAELFTTQKRADASSGSVQPDPWPLLAGGNDLSVMVKAMESGFVPEIEPLFESFLRMQEHGQFVDQIGWTVGRSGMRRVILGLESRLRNDDVPVRLAAALLIEAAGTGASEAWPPIHGGMGASPPPRQISLFVDEGAATSAFETWSGPAGEVPPAAGDEDKSATTPRRSASFRDQGRFSLTSPGDVSDDEAATAEEELAIRVSGDADTDPPRTAYAHLRCPRAVTAGDEFDLEVGIAKDPDSEVAGPELVRPIWSRGPYVLTVQVVAEGFTLKPGEMSRHELPVTVEKPYPAVVLHLTANPQTEDVVPRMIQVTYFVGSQPIGVAYRALAVRKEESVSVTLPDPVPLGSVMTVPGDGATEPDLTVQITEGQVAGDLLWTFETPHVATPTEPVTTSIDDDPDTFTRQLINRMDRPTDKGLGGLMRGIGSIIEQATPPELWNLLARVAAASGDRPPTVFIVSQDPFVPWELALVETPFDPKSAPFLGAQATLGRWVMPRPGKNRPELPPLERRTVDSMAVMCGRYPADHFRWTRLEHAEHEAAELQERYTAEPLEANLGSMLDFLDKTSETDALHFAGHAIHDPNSPENGLVFSDLTFFDSIQVLGEQLAVRPFIFLNACQSGVGYTVLGSCAGFVGAFLFAGASGVVAPFWSVNDAAAQDIARDFYRQALEENISPAEALRRRRASFGKDADGNDIEPDSAVNLAYQFFGHPNLRLVRNAPIKEAIHA
ncbi:MAG: CHAT domain-containing protein [Chloroflexia bacterium]|nr:CHAT domain-containing protein [Chloroflexia bacterium]